MIWDKYDIRDLSDSEYRKWYSLMSEEKQRRVDRFRFVDDQKRTIAGEMLARRMIEKWCKIDAESIVFGKKEGGKPYAKALAVEFNISHSGDMVVCAVDDKSVGIDIEQIRPIDLKVAKRICTEEELLYLFGYKPTEEDYTYTTNNEILTRFFQLWTAKEAYGKYLGKGIEVLLVKTNKPHYTVVYDNYVISIYK